MLASMVPSIPVELYCIIDLLLNRPLGQISLYVAMSVCLCLSFLGYLFTGVEWTHLVKEHIS